MASLLVVAGAILFVIPEPVTSLVGVVLGLAGVASLAGNRRWR